MKDKLIKVGNYWMPVSGRRFQLPTSRIISIILILGGLAILTGTAIGVMGSPPCPNLQQHNQVKQKA